MLENRKLALFDLDGTLIDDSYSLTDDAIIQEIESTRDRSWDIGISSDTPYEILSSWRDQLGMNGPIIAEKGAIVEVDDRLIFNKNTAKRVEIAQKAIVNYLRDSKHTTVWSGNSTEAIRQKRIIGEPGHRSVLINNLSKCSLRFFVRKITPNGDMVIDNTVTQETIGELSKFYPSFDHVSVDNNPSFGLMIIADGLVDKRTGLETLLENRPYGRVVMSGNSMGDYIGEDLVEQFAVSNAEADYRHKAKQVNRPLTSGCIDILKSLD